MDTATSYRVVFGGHTLNGFEPEKVRNNLRQRLKLSEAQIARLFDGKNPHTLKRTASEEEARRYVMQLARLGAIATVESDTPSATPEPQTKETKSQSAKNEATKADKQKKTEAAPPPLPGYTPLSGKLLFKPLLYSSAGLEILLTLVYAFLLLMLASGVFYYSLFTLWASTVVGNPLLAMLLQLLCFVFGGVALALLAKPLLTLAERRHRGIALSPEHEEDIQLFVEDLCERMNLPLPQEIRLNNDSSVQLAHRRGLLGFMRGETTLTLSVPLMAMLNTNQLAAAIAQANELFRPSAGPRSGFIVLASHRWLHQAVYGKDVLDRGLQRWGDEGRLSEGLVKALQQLFDASRRVMRIRLIISRGIERRLVHRLVAEADKSALTLAGSEGFAQLVEQQRLLSHTSFAMLPKLRQQWYDKGTLPQDLIQLLLQQVRRYPAAINARLSDEQERGKARSGDIFPSDAQRLQAVADEPCEAGYHCLSPAITLARYFSKLALTMSLRFYHNRLGIPVTPDKLVRVLPRGSAEALHEKRISAYFNRLWQPLIPLKLGLAMQGLDDAATARHTLQQSTETIQQSLQQARMDLKKLQENEAELLDDASRELLYRAEMWRELGEGKLRKDELEQFYERCRQSEGDYDVALQKVREQLKPYSQRLAAALSLMPHTHEQGEALLGEAQQLIALNDRIDAVHTPLHELRMHTRMLQVLLSYRRSGKQSRLDDRIAEQASDIRQRLTSIGVALKGLPTPFDAPFGGETLMDYLLLEAYSDETPDGDFDRGNDVVVRLATLQKRLVARLIELALQAEKAQAG